MVLSSVVSLNLFLLVHLVLQRKDEEEDELEDAEERDQEASTNVITEFLLCILLPSEILVGYCIYVVNSYAACLLLLCVFVSMLCPSKSSNAPFFLFVFFFFFELLSIFVFHTVYVNSAHFSAKGFSNYTVSIF